MSESSHHAEPAARKSKKQQKHEEVKPKHCAASLAAEDTYLAYADDAGKRDLSSATSQQQSSAAALAQDYSKDVNTLMQNRMVRADQVFARLEKSRPAVPASKVVHWLAMATDFAITHSSKVLLGLLPGPLASAGEKATEAAKSVIVPPANTPEFDADQSSSLARSTKETPLDMFKEGFREGLMKVSGRVIGNAELQMIKINEAERDNDCERLARLRSHLATQIQRLTALESQILLEVETAIVSGWSQLCANASVNLHTGPGHRSVDTQVDGTINVVLDVNFELNTFSIESIDYKMHQASEKILRNAGYQLGNVPVHRQIILRTGSRLNDTAFVILPDNTFNGVADNSILEFFGSDRTGPFTSAVRNAENLHDSQQVSELSAASVQAPLQYDPMASLKSPLAQSVAHRHAQSQAGAQRILSFLKGIPARRET